MDTARKDPDAFIEADLDCSLALAEAAGKSVDSFVIDSIVVCCVSSGWESFRWKRPGARAYHHKKFWKPLSTAIRWEPRRDEGAFAQVREDSRPSAEGQDPKDSCQFKFLVREE